MRLMPPVPLPRSTWLAVAAIAVAGLLLRIAAARGGLWIDEAWSSLFAAETGSPAGVFLYINHDNNHHLNTLWLLLAGMDAPPLLARALSLAAGTVTIPLAAIIAARRGAAAAWVTALLFAVSEAMVTYGSEARGYAPMMLAALAALLLVDRWLDDPERKPPARALAWCALLGLLAHLTMALMLAALGLWAGYALARRLPPAPAFARLVRLFWPSLLATLAVAALLIGAALASDTGFQVGSVTRFSLGAFEIAMAQIVSSGIGLAAHPLWLLPLAIAAFVLVSALFAPGGLGPRGPFYLIAILGLPAAMAILQPANGVILRYYLVSVIALILLAGEWIGGDIAAGGRRRWAAALILIVLAGFGLARDVELIRNRRGDPDGPVRLLAAAFPEGARLAIANDRARAPLLVAAAQADYPLEIVEGSCAEAAFLLVDRDPGKPAPGRLERCGRRFVAVAGARTSGLSGGDWTLYARRRLPSAAPPVSDPPPTP